MPQIQSITPYIMFNGTAADAIRHYEVTLGAKVEVLQRFHEVPGNNPSPETRDRVMHAFLRLGGGSLMISDSLPELGLEPGGSVNVCLDFTDLDDMARRFEALAAGGSVTMALHDTFWGAKFGTLTDAFGVQWMFNCMTKKT